MQSRFIKTPGACDKGRSLVGHGSVVNKPQNEKAKKRSFSAFSKSRNASRVIFFSSSLLSSLLLLLSLLFSLQA
jgi:hypothetical protein